MSPLTEKRMLQVATALACFVPLSMGVTSVLRSAAVLKGVEPPLPIDLDSHFRYLSGLLLGTGLVFSPACGISSGGGRSFWRSAPSSWWAGWRGCFRCSSLAGLAPDTGSGW
jgi:hypothetical protein